MRADKCKHLCQHFRRGGNNIARLQPALFTVHIGNDAARFLHDERACGDVLRIQAEIKKTVRASCRQRTPAGYRPFYR